MPDPALQQALKEAYAAAPTSEVLLHTLEFRHADFTAPIRVVLDHQDWNLTLEGDAPANPGESVTFVGFAFDVQLPDVETNPAPEVVITIDNVTPDIEDNLRLAAQSATPVSVTYRPYLASDPSAPQMDPPLHLTLLAAKADNHRVTARAGFVDVANKAFPAEEYTAVRFPGLIR